MPFKIKKSVEMSDIKIDYLSFVNKAANKHEWLIKKEQGSTPQFVLEGKIIKADTTDNTHTVVGIVYEPLTADTDDNFMTADEIKKACDWFNENGLGSDEQHNEQLLEGVEIKKSYIVEEDTEIEGKVVKAGTWIAEAEITNEELWDKIEKGDITGWSMGGKGKYSTQDVNIDEVEKSVSKSILGKIAKAFGFTWDGKAIEDENAFDDLYQQKMKKQKFWTAFEVLQDVLYPWNDDWGCEKHFQDNAEVIKGALEGFAKEIQNILACEDIAKAITPDEDTVKKAVGKINKAGKKISAANMNKLKNAQQVINDLVALDEEEEEEEVEKSEVQKMVQEEIKKALTPAGEGKQPEDNGSNLEAMIAKAVSTQMEAAGIKKEAEETQEEVIANLVAKAMKPYLGSKQTINEDEDTENIEKSEKGSVFSGMFGSTGL